MLQAHRSVRTHPLITRDTWSLCCVLSLTAYQIFVILNLTRLLIMTGYSNTHIFLNQAVFFHISLKLDIDHAWGQIRPAPCQLGWLDKQTGSVSKLPTAKGFWEHGLHSLAWWSGFMSNVSVTHTHANSSLTPEGSCKTPRAVKAKQRWCKSFLLIKEMTLHDRVKRLYMFSTRGWHISCPRVFKKMWESVFNVCVHAWVWASFTSPSFTATQLRQHSPLNTPSHVRVCVKESKKWSVPVLKQRTKGEGGGLRRNLRKKKEAKRLRTGRRTR